MGFWDFWVWSSHFIAVFQTRLPHWVKTQYLHFRFHANYSPLHKNIPEEISRKDDRAALSKGSVYHRKHVHISFYHSSGLTRNWMSNGSIYYVLYLQILCVYLVYVYYDPLMLLFKEFFLTWNFDVSVLYRKFLSQTNRSSVCANIIISKSQWCH